MNLDNVLFSNEWHLFISEASYAYIAAAVIWSHLSNAFQAKSWDCWQVILAPLVMWIHGFSSRCVRLTVAQIDMTFKLVLVDLFFNLAQRYYVSKETATFLVYTQLGKWLSFLPIKTSSSLFLLPWTVAKIYAYEFGSRNGSIVAQQEMLVCVLWVDVIWL